jgi:hypothetical protein
MRNKLLFIGVTVAAVGIGAVIFSSGRMTPSTVSPAAVVNSTPKATTTVPFTRLLQGTQSSVVTRTNYLITSPAQLKNLWKLIAATSTPPTVDFKTKAVLAVFADKASSLAITVSKIEDTDARLVSITLAKPDSTCTKKNIAASPYEIITVPVTSLSLTHEDIATTTSCPK